MKWFRSLDNILGRQSEIQKGFQENKSQVDKEWMAGYWNGDGPGASTGEAGTGVQSCDLNLQKKMEPSKCGPLFGL